VAAQSPLDRNSSPEERFVAYHLAQINISRLLAPIDDPQIAGFVNQLDETNALADRAPGFVWRLKSESGNATDIAYNDDPFVIVNMSVWESIGALRGFAYKSDHAKVFRDRAKWFERWRSPAIAFGGFRRATFLPWPKAASGWSITKRMARRHIPFGFRSSSLSRRTRASVCSSRWIARSRH